MSIAKNGDIEIYYEEFGDVAGPVILLSAGFGGQCISFHPDFCQLFVESGFGVIRYDHRDLGLSTIFEASGRVSQYTLLDMAGDAIAVLDSAGVDRAHVVGYSMGGFIVQLLAIEYPKRVLTMTSVSSTTGDPDVGGPTAEALEVLLSPLDPPATRRDDVISEALRKWRVAAAPATFDAESVAAAAAESYDRSHRPDGLARQREACRIAGSRTDALRNVQVPALVIHGDADGLIDVSGGRRTAEAIPNAGLVVIEGMGHDLAPVHWHAIVEPIVALARSA